MYSLYTTTSLMLFFIVGYSLITLPLIIILKSNARYRNVLINQLQSKGNIHNFLLIVFFIISGLPLTNTFLFKWLCLVNILNSGNYYTSIVFIILNLFSILLYYTIFFNRVVIFSYSNQVVYTSHNVIDTYWVNMYVLISIYYNVFGFFLVNLFICLV